MEELLCRGGAGGLGGVYQFAGVLEEFLDMVEELGGLGAVDNTVIDGKGEGHFFPDLDLAAVGDTLFADAADTENGCLAWDDNGDEGVDAEFSEIGDGHAAAF